MQKIFPFLQLGTASFLFLLCSIFWGNWLSLSRSYHHLPAEQMARLAKIITNNLKNTMRLISSLYFFLLAITLIWHFYGAPQYVICSLLSFILIALAVILTILKEIPLNEKMMIWTVDTSRKDYMPVIAKLQYFNHFRVPCAVLSVILYIAGLLHF